MQKIISVLILSILSGTLLGQTNYDKFKKLSRGKDTVKLKSLLADWETNNPNDPELYTSGFNYYFSASKQEIISIEQDKHGKEGFRLTDSTGETAGYLSSDLHYKSDKLKKAFAYIDNGIEKFPTRLDMRFGKCYALQLIGDYENFTKELLKTVEYSNTIKNNWLWTENKKTEDGQKLMLESIQTYLKELYDTEDDNLLSNMIRIGDATIKYYPNNVEILSTTAVAHLLTKNYDKALEYLKKAEQINPKDFIVLNNIAQGYKLKGDRENAVKYYELTEKYGDEQAKQQARQEIKMLKKN